MKKSAVWIVCVMMLSLLFSGIPKASAAGATLSFSKTSLRPGDTFSVTLNVSLSGAITVNGSFAYSSNVRLTGISKSTGTLDANGNAFFVDLGSEGVSGTKAVAVANFQVLSSAKTGEAISVSFDGYHSNLGGDYPVSGAASVRVAAPLSTNCDLGSLTVAGITLSPAFSPDRTAYSAGEVDFSVSTLEIQASPADSKGKVSVSGNALSVGENTVSITVRAENGAAKTYTISVTRKQDPNYVPSSNAALAGIKVDGFLISPPFANGVEEYVVWLPYETENISVSAMPADSKATVTVVGGSGLLPGADNRVTVICTAEDGSQKEYTVIAKRAAAHGEQPAPTEMPTQAQTEPIQPVENAEKIGMDVEFTVLLCVLSAALGAGIVFAIMKLYTKKQKNG